MTAAFSPPFRPTPTSATPLRLDVERLDGVCTSAQFVKIQTFLAAALHADPRLARRRRGVLGRRRLRRRGASGRRDRHGWRRRRRLGRLLRTGFAAAIVRGGVLVTVGRVINTGTPQNRRGDELRRDLHGQRRRRWRWREWRQRLRLGRSGGHSGEWRRRRAGAAGFTGHIQIGPSATDFATAVGGWLALGGTPQPGQCGVGGFLPGPNAAPDTRAGGSGAAVNQLASGFGTTHFGGNGGSACAS